MEKRVLYIQQEKTEHLCSNCNEQYLSIANEKNDFSKKNNLNEVKPDKIETVIREPEDTDNLTGILLFVCQNCKAEYFYETDFFIDEKTYRSMNPKSSEKEVQEYVNNTKDLEEKAFPLYRIDINKTVKDI